MKLEKESVDSTTQLLERNRFIESLVNMTPGILYIYDLIDRKNVYSNNGIQRILGYSAQEIQAMGSDIIPILMHPEDLPIYLEKTISRYATAHDGELVVHQYRMKHKSGNWRWLSSSESIYLRLPDGSPKQIFGMIHDITDSKLAEETLQKNEEHLRAILDSTPFPIAVVDVEDNVIQYWSKSAHEKFGHTAPTTPEWYMRAYPDPEYRQDVIERWKPFLETAKQSGKTVNTGEYRVTCRDGSICICELYATFIENDLIVTFNDITERKRLEESQKQSELEQSILLEKLNEAQHIATIGSWEWDLNTNLVWWSDETYRIFGLNAQDYTPSFEGNSKFIHPDDLDNYRESFEYSLRTGNPIDLDIRVGADDGLLKYCLAKGRIISEGSGHKKRFVGTIMDITKRKQAEEAVAAEKERLAVTLSSIGDGVISTDTDGTIIHMNKEAEDLTGWSQSDASGKPLTTVLNIINENTRLPQLNPVNEVLSTGQIVELANHTILISKDGTERIIADSAAPIKDINSVIIGVVLVFRDMTEKQKLFIAAQNVQKLESLGILAGGIAHDFNNLMGGIFGYIDNAIEISRDDNVTRNLTKAMTTIDRARALTQQLLTFAKGGTPIQKVGRLFPFVQETAQFALSGSNVKCSCDAPEDLWLCNYDKNQIGQVIDNIVINAQQAMAMGGTITVSARNITLSDKEHPSLSPGNYVKISVKDTGIGIPKEQFSRIFDPFFTTKTKGHGLGLATSYSIVNKHGGFIDVESELGKGSTFHVYLPASTCSVETDERKAGTTHNGNGTFLVMDDEIVMQETVSTMLGSFGYTVICKEDGIDAIDFFIKETAEKRTVVGMIFDLTVPGGMGGKAAVEEIRKCNSTVPVFVASGYAEDPIMKNPAEHGFTASICKPFRKSELAEMLNKFMKLQ